MTIRKIHEDSETLIIAMDEDSVYGFAEIRPIVKELVRLLDLYEDKYALIDDTQLLQRFVNLAHKARTIIE